MERRRVKTIRLHGHKPEEAPVASRADAAPLPRSSEGLSPGHYLTPNVPHVHRRDLQAPPLTVEAVRRGAPSRPPWARWSGGYEEIPPTSL